MSAHPALGQLILNYYGDFRESRTLLRVCHSFRRTAISINWLIVRYVILVSWRQSAGSVCRKRRVPRPHLPPVSRLALEPLSVYGRLPRPGALLSSSLHCSDRPSFRLLSRHPRPHDRTHFRSSHQHQHPPHESHAPQRRSRCSLSAAVDGCTVCQHQPHRPQPPVSRLLPCLKAHLPLPLPHSTSPLHLLHSSCTQPLTSFHIPHLHT